MRKNQWVVFRNNKWCVRGEQNTKDTKTFDTQKEAIEYARQIAINQKSELIVQNKDGKIRLKNSYGNDSCPPKG